MDLVSFGKETLQNLAEHAASYRLGQSALRQLDRGLWVVEKCARWAVPPPLDQDERPQPELVRPLPWVFFLVMLLILRVAREVVSLANLVMGKPPLRSADVVIFIQSKRRYLRTLKYQGCRIIRARSAAQEQPWYSAIQSLFALTMCFRRESNYGNNNTTQVTNNDEVVVIKYNKRGRQEETAPAPSETTMERLIEKMMLDLDAESDEDSNYVLTTAISTEYTKSDLPESDLHIHPTTPTKPQETEISQTNGDDIHFSPNKNENSSSTPEKDSIDEVNDQEVKENHATENNVAGNDDVASFESADATSTNTKDSLPKESEEKLKLNENITESVFTGNSVSENSISVNQYSENSHQKTCEDLALPPLEEKKDLQLKEETQNFVKSETASLNSQKTSKKDHKIANGRTVKSVPSKKKGIQKEKRDSNEVPPQRVLPSNSSF